MNNQNHTPGPWHVGGKSGMAAPITNTPLRVWANDRAAVAEIMTRRQLGEHSPSPVELANAHLIAAAPDLLAALQFLQPLAIRECPPGISPDYWYAAMQKLEAGLARATVPLLT